MRVLRPPPLSRGSIVRVVAPSSPFDRTLVLRGMGWLSYRYRVDFDAGLFARNGFLAGNDERRTDELNRAFRDPGIGAIVAARGGYGLGRIAPELDLDALLRTPKWIVGFSDLTALHLEATQRGMVTLHANNVAGLGRGDARARADWQAALEGPPTARPFRGLRVLHAGSAHGRLLGGNLTVLFAAHAAGRLDLPQGTVLLLEDVSETSYRIDRMLTALLQSGALARVAAIVLGEFTQCSAGKYRVDTESVLVERLGRLGVPVLGGLPIGHGRLNVPLPLGVEATVDSKRAEVVVDSEGR